MIPMEKNNIHFRQRLLPNCLLNDLEIVTMNGGDSTSQYHSLLTVAKFTAKQKKIKSSYFIATPLIIYEPPTLINTSVAPECLDHILNHVLRIL
jgi:hypothetical protein